MMGFGLLFTVLIVGAVFYLLNESGQIDLFASTAGGNSGKSALEIAKERYARGDIDKEEFEHLRRDLES